MSTSEFYIINAVRSYMNAVGTKHAIMIDGEWGTGKTYLVKNLVIKEVGESHCVYVSLFGLQSIHEIEQEIFKAISMVGDDEDNILTNILNANDLQKEGMKVGGIGYIAQFALNAYKKHAVGKTKSLLMCFDDLERWQGDMKVCLSYINKLVEHEGVKCLLVGNSQELQNNETQFSEGLKKTIGFKYTLARDAAETLRIVNAITEPGTNKAEKFLNNILLNHSERICEILNTYHISNIRTVSLAVQYFSRIYQNNQEIFDKNEIRAFAYFECLLSLVILVYHYVDSKEDKERVLTSSPDSILILLASLNLDQLYTDDDLADLDTEQTLKRGLVFRAFSSGSGVKHTGMVSIVASGFYRPEDFANDFRDWTQSRPFDSYLDLFHTWKLDDLEADSLFKQTYSDIFERKIVTNPNVLMALAERVIADIDRGIVDLDMGKIVGNFVALFEELYSSEEMEPVRLESLRPKSWYRREVNDLYDKVESMNEKYISELQKKDARRFWVKLSDEPYKLDELMDEYGGYPLFAFYEEPTEIVNALEVLSNGELFQFTRHIGSRLDEQKSAVSAEHNDALPIAEALDQRYQTRFGVRAGHMKRLAGMLRYRNKIGRPEEEDEEG